jgi:hypothetical protein
MSDICPVSHSGVPVTTCQFLRSDDGNVLLWIPERHSTHVSYSKGPGVNSWPEYRLY